MNQLALSFAAPKLKPQAVRVALALRQCGDTGTAWDVCSRLGSTQRSVVAKRLSELAAAGCVVAAGSRVGPLGRVETLWRLTDSGSRVAIEAETTP